MFGNIISVNYDVIEKKDNNLNKIRKKMELAIKNVGSLTSHQLNKVENTLKRRLKTKLGEITSANGGRYAGLASGKLFTSIKFDVINNNNTRENTKSGLYEKVYSYNLNMKDYGFIIGEDNFKYYPSKEDAISWIKAKQRKGKRFYVADYKTVKGKKIRDGEHSPRSNLDYSKLAYVLRKNVKQPTVAIPNWYKLNDEKSISKVNLTIKKVASYQAKKLASEINNK